MRMKDEDFGSGTPALLAMPDTALQTVKRQKKQCPLAHLPAPLGGGGRGGELRICIFWRRCYCIFFFPSLLNPFFFL